VFDNVARNAMLEGTGLKVPKGVSTGTTIVGIIFKDGVILGADTRATAVRSPSQYRENTCSLLIPRWFMGASLPCMGGCIMYRGTIPSPATMCSFVVSLSFPSGVISHDRFCRPRWNDHIPFAPCAFFNLLFQGPIVADKNCAKIHYIAPNI
jgi:hypothetical protein